MADNDKTIGTDSRDYSTFTLHEASMSGASGGAGNNANGFAYNDSAFDEAVTYNDTTPDAINITAASGEEHDGTAGTGVRLVQSSFNIINVVCGSDIPHTISWIEIDAGAATGSLTTGLIAVTGGVDTTDQIFRNLIIHDVAETQNGGPGPKGLGGSLGGVECYALNCFVYNIKSSGNNSGPIGIQNIIDNSFNCTVFGIESTGGIGDVDAIGINSGTTKNCISMDSASLNGSASDFSSGTQEYNLSSDTTASGTGSLISKSASNQFVSIVGGSEDLHLKTGADAIDAGTDLATTPTGVNIDIDGRDRDSEGDTWDIGADQSVSADADYSITVQDLVGVQEFLVSTNQLSGISITENITIAEYISVSAVTAITVNIDDTVSIVDTVTVELSSLSPSVYDNISIVDVPNFSFDSFITVNDEITVSEYNLVNVTAISDLNISKFDAVSVLEYAEVQNILGNIFTYDSVSVVDTTDVTCELSGISVFDSITINEDISLDVTVPVGYQIAVSDIVTITEQTNIFSPEYRINVSDTITVSDAVYFLVAFIIGTLHISVTTECLDVSTEVEQLEIFAEVA